MGDQPPGRELWQVGKAELAQKTPMRPLRSKESLARRISNKDRATDWLAAVPPSLVCFIEMA